MYLYIFNFISFTQEIDNHHEIVSNFFSKCNKCPKELPKYMEKCSNKSTLRKIYKYHSILIFSYWLKMHGRPSIKNKY